ncbi:hypothetical protein QFC20_004020 [Naganishia adeliensis]|uniref:Uncharacterized protein n=1 Tax=Naganishia adeliensis TaxID=92952 RepID=A0ACC2W4L5_9TREE|nr:hypothetical protein QFC20_004020 [Naganishia adeliensis]
MIGVGSCGRSGRLRRGSEEWEELEREVVEDGRTTDEAREEGNRSREELERLERQQVALQERSGRRQTVNNWVVTGYQGLLEQAGRAHQETAAAHYGTVRELQVRLFQLEDETGVLRQDLWNVQEILAGRAQELLDLQTRSRTLQGRLRNTQLTLRYRPTIKLGPESSPAPSVSINPFTRPAMLPAPVAFPGTPLARSALPVPPVPPVPSAPAPSVPAPPSTSAFLALGCTKTPARTMMALTGRTTRATGRLSVGTEMREERRA